ncbi:c-type cytochrome [Tropicimonas isoalkanivorans]|uniref:Cytochrome c553 n=1 Tax=Tropicimonas isoalkanivorans TaxID=441112 RepID=A0A1I1EFH9_9RHOB|nr:c-type cytochrome [Tropicimonas isoalkanivorans]SFB85865.1 Cytochrome c553 [Tropicimonas isoalkanivorans]
MKVEPGTPRIVFRTLAALASLGALAGGGVVAFGLYNVSARVGHWPGVGWVLHTTFVQSVKLRAMPEAEVPDLSDPALADLGAQHYATACAPCHAAPGVERSATVRAMVPAPPHIEEAVAHWEANHLHWIVYNGIKMSGMPAWSAPERSAEVWPVVAYLLRVKEGTAPTDLVAQDGGARGDWAAYCQACHEDVSAHVPRLGILSPEYLNKALSDYRDGSRPSGIMEQAASLVPADDIPALVPRMSPRTPAEAVTEAPAGPGADLARRGTDDVPACVACHGPGATRAKAEFPSLAGQDPSYLAAQLSLWRDGLRGGSDVMTKAAMDLSDADIAALAGWYGALSPEIAPALQ